jgi:eukaryotic-like serine/threonine-protein kinase
MQDRPDGRAEGETTPDAESTASALGDEEPTERAAPAALAESLRPPRADRSRSRSGDSTGSFASRAAPSSATRTTEGALIHRNEEVQRSIALMRLVALVTTFSMVAVFMPMPQPGAHVVLTSVFGSTLAITLFLLWRFRDPSHFDMRWVVVQGMFCVASVLAASVYVGIFSPVVMAACVGIYFFGQTDQAWAGWSIYLGCALGYLALHLAALLGWLRIDQSLIAVDHPDLRGLFALAFMMQLLLALIFWMARRTRGATRDAFRRLERAALQIRQREALLNEARADLDHAQAAKLGRYTGLRVGDYLVDEVIGRGAMGEVYQAHDPEKDQPAALKFLHPAALDERDLVERFMREAEVAGSLDSPHVVRVFGTGEAGDGAPFIAMELLRGVDLAQRLREKKRLSVSEVVDLVAQVSRALAAADQAGIVHRDVKPQNLFLAGEGRNKTWKVLDFGVSKIQSHSSTLTRGGAVGTPSYMAPEQAIGGDVDHRADIFALGVIAYRALTGRPAFTGPDGVATLYNVVHVQPARPSVFVRVHADVDRVLALALAKRRERRFASAAMFSAALSDAVSGRFDERLRRSADELIAEEPWGAEVPSA